jgi:hypothetical protein
MHQAQSFGCFLAAIALVWIVNNDYETLPGWVSVMALVTAFLLVVNSVRVLRRGALRKRIYDGPRTKIVIAPIPPDPNRKK